MVALDGWQVPLLYQAGTCEPLLIPLNELLDDLGAAVLGGGIPHGATPPPLHILQVLPRHALPLITVVGLQAPPTYLAHECIARVWEEGLWNQLLE
jgi:hypothetical protein